MRAFTTIDVRNGLVEIAQEMRLTAKACSRPPMRGDPESLNKAADALEEAIKHIDAHIEKAG